MTESERDKESIRILRNALILTLTRMCVHQPNHPKFAVPSRILTTRFEWTRMKDAPEACEQIVKVVGSLILKYNPANHPVHIPKPAQES